PFLGSLCHFAVRMYGFSFLGHLQPRRSGGDSLAGNVAYMARAYWNRRLPLFIGTFDTISEIKPRVMVLHVIAFMISASVLAVVGVLFLALLLVKLNNTQQQAREAYLKELVYDREQTMAVVAREVHDHMKQMLYMARRNLKTV